MPRFFFLFFLLFIFNNSNAQNAIAKLKYEDAEAAYEKADYASTLKGLDEVEKILGKPNQKTSYLRIMAECKELEANPDASFLQIESARKHVQNYLQSYSDLEGIEEKYRDVYEASKKLVAYPSSAAAYLEASERKQREISQRKERERLAREEALNDYVYYEGWEGLLGKNIEEIKKVKGSWFPKKYKPGVSARGIGFYTITNEKGGEIVPGSLTFTTNGNILTQINGNIYFFLSSNTSEAEKKFSEMVSELNAKFGPATTNEVHKPANEKVIEFTIYHWIVESRWVSLYYAKANGAYSDVIHFESANYNKL